MDPLGGTTRARRWPRAATVAAAVLLAAAPARAGTPSAVVDLRDLPTTDGLARVYGSAGVGSFGVPVAGGVDCDDDGHADLALSSMTASPLGRTAAGQVFLVFGDGTVSGTLDTGTASERILAILGDGPSENAGSEIWMDDVTGDGLGDLLIARQNFSPDAGRLGAGALTIVAGGAALRTRAAALAPLDLRSPPAEIPVLTLIGAQAFGRLGSWIRTGDVTGDGVAEIVVGADQESGAGEPHHGAAYVVRGGAHLAAGGTVDLADFGATVLAGHLVRLVPPAGSAEDHFGATCQVADLDGNQRAEVLIAAALNRAGATLLADGAPPGSAHGSGGTPRGTVYVAWDDNFPSGAWAPGLTFDVTLGPGSHSVVHGGARNRSFGEEILAGLDYDGDGRADLFVGDIVGDGTVAQTRPASGSGHVLYDAATLKGLTFDLDTAPVALASTTFLGPAAGTITADTAAHGDLDGDGIADLGLASPLATVLGRASAGAFHVVHGQQARWPALVDLAPGALPAPGDARVTAIYGGHGTVGSDAGDVLGYSAAAADLDGDGKVDLITNEMLGNGPTPATEDVGNMIVVGGALIAGAAPPAGPPQTLRQRRCVLAMNRGGVAVAVAQGAASAACLRHATRGRTARLGAPSEERTAAACLGNDVGGRVGRRVARLHARDAAACRAAAELPPFGYTGGAAVAAAATGAVRALVGDLFGPDLDAAIVLAAADRAAARCQAEALARTLRVFHVLWKQGLAAKHDGLRGRRRAAPATSSAELADAILGTLAADPRARFGRAAAALADRLAARCAGRPLGGIFPGACGAAGDPAALAACVTARARCRFCAALGAFDGLAPACDLFDDDTADASCGDLP